jgi:acyl-CoA dehydrogenase
MRGEAKRGPRDWIEWPFFEPRHRALVERLDAFIASPELDAINHHDVDGSCRRLVREMGRAGFLEAAVAPADSDATAIDSRSACLARETFAWRDGLADFAFAMQGLGSGAIAIAGSPELRAAVLPKTRAGEWLAAFALSEKEAGSDAAAMSCSALLDGDSYVIDGEKTWISNGGIADVYKRPARAAFPLSSCFPTIAVSPSSSA